MTKTASGMYGEYEKATAEVIMADHVDGCILYTGIIKHDDEVIETVENLLIEDVGDIEKNEANALKQFVGAMAPMMAIDNIDNL